MHMRRPVDIIYQIELELNDEVAGILKDMNR